KVLVHTGHVEQSCSFRQKLEQRIERSCFPYTRLWIGRTSHSQRGPVFQQQPDKSHRLYINAAHSNDLRHRKWPAGFIMPVIAFVGVTRIKHAVLPFLNNILYGFWTCSSSFGTSPSAFCSGRGGFNQPGRGLQLIAMMWGFRSSSSSTMLTEAL